MTFRSLRFAWVLAGVVLSTLVSVHGQQPPSRRGQPILFSEPRYNTAMSNLDEIATQKSAFQNPAKELKKPSNIFDASEGSASLFMPPLRQLPPPNVNSKRLKALLDKRNDRAFQAPDDLAAMLTAEEIFKIPEFDRDDQAKGDDLFGRQRENEGRDDTTFFGTEKTPGVAVNVPALTSKPLFGVDSS